MGARGSNRGHGTVSEQRRRPQGKAGKLRRHVGVGTWTYRTWPASSRFQAAPTILPPHIHLASRHLGVFLTVSLLYNLLSLSSIRYVTWSSPVPGRRHCAEIRTRRRAEEARGTRKPRTWRSPPVATGARSSGCTGPTWRGSTAWRAG